MEVRRLVSDDAVPLTRQEKACETKETACETKETKKNTNNRQEELR